MAKYSRQTETRNGQTVLELLRRKEVNKDFYKQIKDQFDSLIGIAKSTKTDVDEAITKQFAVRLIGRYIFCWFLKEKKLYRKLFVASGTIENIKACIFRPFFPNFFNTLNAEVTDPHAMKPLPVSTNCIKIFLISMVVYSIGIPKTFCLIKLI